MKHKILTLCAAALLLLFCVVPVYAEEFDPEKTGSVSVTLTEQYEKAPITNAELSLYYIATVHVNADGKLSYLYTDAFSEVGVALDDPELTAKLDGYLSDNHTPSAKLRTDENGTAVFENLPLGLYFIRQTNTVEGFAPCTPFLVTVPMEDANGYMYEVNASPKTEVAKLTTITIRKIWNTDASTQAAQSVTVQLLRSGNVVETATLNENNSWQVTYTNMPESDAYSIQEINIPKGFTATYQQNAYVFTVTNTSTLIQTGQLIWPIPVLAAVGLCFIAAGTIVLKKTRNQNA